MRKVFPANPGWRAVWLSIGLALLACADVHAGVHLLLDINQTPGSTPGTTASSSPSDFVAFDGHLVFVADDGVHGRELWQSDGTAAGTKMIVDLVPGAGSSVPNNLLVANGLLYFFASDSQGVSHLMVLAPGSATPLALTQLSNSQFNSGVCSSVLGDKLYITGWIINNGYYSFQLWVTDGTVGGTIQIPRPTDTTLWQPCPEATFDNTLYFSQPDYDNTESFWYTTGAFADAKLFAELPSDVYGGIVTKLNGALYFDGEVTGPPLERSNTGIYRADGTQVIAAQILAGGIFDSTGDFVHLLGVSAGRLVAEDVAVQPNLNPVVTLAFSSDGATFTSLPNKFLGPIFINGGQTFALVPTSPSVAGSSVTPWVTDGTVAGTHQLATIGQSGASAVDWFADYHGTTVFSLVDPAQGAQLWRTDGTNDRTALVSNIPSQENMPPAVRGVSGRTFFFVANDPVVGAELYVYVADPVAVDITGTASDGNPVQLTVLSGAYEPGAGTIDTSSVKIVSAASHGVATVGADGVITYVPNTGYSGDDSFTYTVADSSGTTSVPARAKLTVTVSGAGSGHSGGGTIRLSELMILLAVFAVRMVSVSGRSRRLVEW